MRYFLVAWALLCVMSVGILGFRGGLSRKPPIEIFSDMDRQLKVRPQEPSDFYADNRGSRLPVAGTVARTEPVRGAQGLAGQASVMPFEESPVTTGRINGSTNFVEVSPLPVTAESMARGRQRFDIYCLPCHGPLGDGNSVTKKLGMQIVANLHDPRIVRMPDGELFSTITVGSKSLVMGSYAAQISVEDRWAVVAYLRALQFSRLGTLDDVPADQRASLKK